jgi:hypothetical protein
MALSVSMGAAQTLTQDAAKARDKIVKLGVGKDVTLVRRDGREFYGSIVEIKPDAVMVDEVDMKVRIELRFDELKKVAEGYGSSRAWNGTRIPPKKHRIGLILGTAAIAIPLILVLTGRD